MEQNKTFIPLTVRNEADWLLEHTGVEATVTRESTGVIRISHGHARLRVETVYRAARTGWRRASSRLYQDGKRRDNVSWDAYPALFETLRGEGPQPTTESPGLVDLTPLPSGAAVPAQVRAELAQLETGFREKPGFELSVGRDDQQRLVAQATMTSGTLQLIFETKRRSGKWFSTVIDSRLVVADGVDCTSELEATECLAEFLVSRGAVSDGAGPGGHRTGSGPASRKGTVLRL